MVARIMSPNMSSYTLRTHIIRSARRGGRDRGQRVGLDDEVAGGPQQAGSYLFIVSHLNGGPA